MKAPFQYRKENPHADESARKGGMILLDRPQAGDWVCQYSVSGEPVATVKANTDSNSRVSRYLSRRRVDFVQDFYTFTA
jgi:hypothetical protein